MQDDDFLGRDLDLEQIEKIALAARIFLRVDQEAAPAIYFAVEAQLAEDFPHTALLPRSRADLPNHRARATTSPPVIEVREDIYDAGDESPAARFVLAHELGHQFLHREMARSLKDGAQERKLLANNAHRSSEQQADAFARFFLVPRHVAERLGTIDRIMSECRVAFDVARDVMRYYGIKLSRRLLPYEVQAQLDCDEDDML